MDFFAAGGFQQLFCDLDDTATMCAGSSVESSTADMEGYSGDLASYDYCTLLPVDSNDNTLIHLTRADDPFVLTVVPNTTATEQSPLEWHVDWSESGSKATITCTTMPEHELQLNIDQLLDASPAALSEIDCSRDVLDAGLMDFTSTESTSSAANSNVEPITIVELDNAAAAFITRDMAEWEEKFLDNYIEIPELIDFLPEKTPLCTETCEHFLRESSKNLKLHRKVRSTKRSSAAQSNVTEAINTSYARDERTPTGYICNFGGFCNKVYAKPAHLKAHLRRHMGEKPYICSWPDCTWKFSRSDELARHRRSHSGVKPYKCCYCMKCFARSDHLTKHRKVHERKLLAASKAGKTFEDGVLPPSIFTVRPGRKRKNQIC